LSPVAQSSPVADKQPSVTTGETRQRKVSKVSVPRFRLEDLLPLMGKHSYLVWKIWQAERFVQQQLHNMLKVSSYRS
jgi:hypothetical protein